jgi:hypothetical protein
MTRTEKEQNLKFGIRNPESIDLCPEKRTSRIEATLPQTAFRISIFEFRISAPAACCVLLTAFCLLFSSACGYHVAGQATRVPLSVKTIAVPPFKNASSTFHIEQQLSAAVTREFLQRTHYRIVPNAADADAVLLGTVKDVHTRAITFDVNTGLATSMQTTVSTEVKLEDVHSHKLLYSNSNYIYREEYQVSETPSALFEEDKPALDRLSRDFARTLVTDILENF